MRPDERDLAYVWDMLDAARRAERLIAGMDFAAFVDDERTSLAIERLLENIGEAARHVSPTLQDGHPEIPWQGIIGMRNVLAHQYGVVDQGKVWTAAKDGIAALLPLLESLLPGAAEAKPDRTKR
jgi:uncharacterized protein with HEPN domain